MIALAIGHNENTGATSCTGDDEWTWNMLLATMTQHELKKRGYESKIYHRDRSLGYTSAMKKHGREMKRDGISLALEFHFNSYSQASTGFEFLFWWRSRKSIIVAKTFAEEFGNDHPSIPARRSWISLRRGYKSLFIKSWNKKKADQRRGAEFCYFTPCPAIILEPGFASNPLEWQYLTSHMKELAVTYANAAIKSLKNI